MARKFVTLEAHCGNDYVNAEWTWSYILKFLITSLQKSGFPILSLSVSPPVAPTWVRGNQRWGGNTDALRKGEIQIFKEYLKAGGGLVYYETSYNTINAWYPDISTTERSLEDYINASCKRLTIPFNPFTGIYEKIENLTREPFGIDAAHEYLGNLGDDGQVKAVINGQTAVSCWANYLCGAERLEYGGSCPFSPALLSRNWLSKYTNLFNETPFCWLFGLQCIIPYRANPNPAVNQTHLYQADQKPRNWCSKTPLEDTTFNIEWLLSSDELEDLRAGTFLMIKDKFLKDSSMNPIFASNTKDIDWRHYSIPGQVTPSRPQNLAESHLIDEMKGTDSQLYGMWKTYTQDMFDYLLSIKRNNANVEIFSDATSKKMVVQQYHDAIIQIPHEKIIDIATFIANKVANWQIGVSEYYGAEEFLVNRPPDFVKLTYDSENEFYTLAEAWWILLYAWYLIATNDGLTTIPDITLQPVIGPCEPNLCPQITGEGLPSIDSAESINVWWQHDAFSGFNIKFKDVKKAVIGLFPQAQTNKPVGPIYPSDRRVTLPKVRAFWPLLDENGNTVTANAAEVLYVLAQMLLNWIDDKETPDPVGFLPSHVLPKMFFDFCQDGSKENPFGTDIDGQANWFNIGQRWTLKPAVLKPEYR